jgi:hypothetical protein
MSEDSIDFAAESYRFEEQYFWYREGIDLLDAVLLAWRHRQLVPDWVGQNLARIRQQGRDGNIESWDDLFGKPWGSGQQRGAWTRTRAVGAYLAVQELIAEEALTTGKPPAIDSALFERAGRRSGIGGRSTVAELYSLVKRAIEAAG